MSKNKRGRNWYRPDMNNPSTEIVKNNKENLAGGGLHYGGADLHDALCKKMELHQNAEAGLHYGAADLRDDVCQKMDLKKNATADTFYREAELQGALCQHMETHQDYAAGIHYGGANLHDDLCKKMELKQSETKPVENKAAHTERLDKKYSDLSLKRIVLMVCAALTLVRRGNMMRYYTGHCYKPLTMKRFVNAATYALPEEMQQRVKSLQPFRDAHRYYECMQLDEPDVEVTDYWVTFENGDVNVRTGEFTAHSPDHLTFFEVNARYTPGNVSCPHMDQLLNFMTGGDRVSIQLVWEMIAFLMLDTPPQRAFFYIGMAPASGKNVLGEFIGRLFGEEECHYTNAEKLGDQFGLAGFYSRRVCLGLESQGNLSRSAITAIKAVTGNDKLNIERKGHDREDIKNRTRLIIASNDPLCARDDAFWDRCKIIPAVQSCPPEQRDPGLAEKIWAERDAIVTCAILAAQQLIERDFRFVESEYALALKKEWRHEAQDSLSSFFEEQVEFVPGAEFVPTREIYEAYMAGGYDPMKERGFAMKIKDKIGIRAKKDRVEGVNGYWDLRLRKLEE